MPAVPTADHFTGLDNAFAERKSQVRAKILKREDSPVPTKERDVEAVGFHAVAKPF